MNNTGILLVKCRRHFRQRAIIHLNNQDSRASSRPKSISIHKVKNVMEIRFNQITGFMIQNKKRRFTSAVFRQEAIDPSREII